MHRLGHGRRAASSGARALARREWLLTAIGGMIVLVVLLLTLALPYLNEKRRIATDVPQPSPLFEVALVELHAGQMACSDEIDLLPGRQVAEIRVGTYGKSASPLLVTMTGPGFSATLPVAPTYLDNGPIEIPFVGPAKALEGSVCVSNLGRRRIALYASGDRTKSRSRTLVDGRSWPSNFDLTFYAPQPQSLLDRAGAIMRRLRLFHAGVGLGLLWLLAFLFVIGVPVASIAVVALAARRLAGESDP